jgi:hypothetical protein
MSDDTLAQIDERTRQEDEIGGRSPRSKRFWLVLAVAALLVGFLARSLVGGDIANSFLADLLPWMSGTPVTLYFGDESGTFLVPVSRTLTTDEDSPQGLVDALLAGPEDEAGLVNLIPKGTVARFVSVSDATFQADLSGDFLELSSPLTREALIQSLNSWPGDRELEISVDGVPLDVAASSGHLLFFYHRSLDMLIAQPVPDDRARDVLSAYLEGPEDPRLTGLPADVQVLTFEKPPGSGLLEVNLTYVPSVREFATEDGDAMRRVLEGLIATLTTGFPGTHFIYLDFEGHASLGLGQCANLLRRAQPQPEILNDERLLGLEVGAS